MGLSKIYDHVLATQFNATLNWEVILISIHSERYLGCHGEDIFKERHVIRIFELKRTIHETK